MIHLSQLHVCINFAALFSNEPKVYQCSKIRGWKIVSYKVVLCFVFSAVENELYVDVNIEMFAEFFH